VTTPERPPAASSTLGLRLVAIFEAVKGLLVLFGGTGLLLLVHRNVQVAAERLIGHLHLDPASRYPRIFLHAATEATPGRLRLLALGALVYASIRLAEAAGLWLGRRWAEWFGAATGLIYVPFEAAALIRRPGVEPALALVVNVLVVIFLGRRLKQHPPDSAGTSRAEIPTAGDAAHPEHRE
jgi:uncharacterized membrane protein (DUF2068 family)